MFKIKTLLTLGSILSNKLYIRLAQRIFLSSVSIFTSVPAGLAQGNTGIFFNFVKPHTQQSLEEVASNVLRIKNGSGQRQEITVNISVPEGWQLFSKAGNAISLNPGDSLFMPVRVIPAKSSQGSTHYLVNAFLTASNGLQLANDYWYVDIKKVTNWTVKIPRQKIYFINDSSIAQFEFIIQNSGNSDEKIMVEFTPQRNLQVVDSAGNKLPSLMTIPVKSGKDSIIVCRVKKLTEAEPSAKAESDRNLKEKYFLKISARNEPGNDNAIQKLWRGNIDFFELGRELIIEGQGYLFIPLTVELNSYDILDNTTLSLDIYGAAHFQKDRSLVYRYQTNYVNNFVEARAYIGSYHYLGYFSRAGALEIGNLSSGKQGSFTGGKGIKGSLFTKRNQLSGMFVLNPEIFGNHFQTGISANNVFRSRKFSSDSYFQRKWDDFSKVNASYLGTASSCQINSRHTVRATIGGSHEEHYFNPASRLSLFGGGYELGYTGSIKRLTLGASHRYGSKNFSNYSGVLSFASSLSYNFSEKYGISLLYDYYHREPQLYSSGMQLPGQPPTNRQRYELRLSASTKAAKIILRPYYMYQNIYLLRTATKAVGVDYRPATENDFRFYTSIEAGFVKAFGTGLADFFFAQFLGNFKYQKLTASLRYFYGPYQALEQIRFVQTGQNSQKLTASGYYNYWLMKGRVSLKTNAAFNYDTYFNRLGFLLRPELFYYSKNGYTISLYAEYLLNAQAARTTANIPESSAQRSLAHDFNFGAGIKKTFNIPLNRRKFHDVEIVVYKDQNGNGQMDSGEESVENMLIRIKGEASADTAGGDQPYEPVNYELLTGRTGVKFENLPSGNYSIQVLPLVETGGWFHEKQGTYVIDAKKKIAVPLVKAARVSGSIALEMDKYSRFEGSIDLSRIRITATSAAGNTYSVLTGKDGEFSMFLPVGEYSIDVNKSALGSSFEFVKSSVKIILNNPNDNYSITFYVRERKRIMNIKEFKE